MVTVPPGFRFHKGLDGLLVGFSIVFLVKVEMVFSSLVNWWLVPEWTYVPITDLASGFTSGIGSTVSAIPADLQVGAGTGGGSGGVLAPGLLVDGLSVGIKVLGIPVLLTGALTANIVEQLLIVVGFWIGVLFPLRWWVLRPLHFWWQGLEAEAQEA